MGEIPTEIINTKRHFFANPDNKKPNHKNDSVKIEDKNKTSISANIVSNEEQTLNECILRVGSQLRKHEVNIYKVLLDYDKEFRGNFNYITQTFF